MEWCAGALFNSIVRIGRAHRIFWSSADYIKRRLMTDRRWKRHMSRVDVNGSKFCNVPVVFSSFFFIIGTLEIVCLGYREMRRCVFIRRVALLGGILRILLCAIAEWELFDFLEEHCPAVMCFSTQSLQFVAKFKWMYLNTQSARMHPA